MPSDIALEDRRPFDNDEHSRQWQANVNILYATGQRLGQIRPTIVAGAAAVLGMVIHTLEPGGLSVIHQNFASNMPTLEWLRNVRSAFPQAVAGN